MVFVKLSILFHCLDYCSGLEIETNTVAFATEFLPFVTKISGEIATTCFCFSVSKQKG